MRTHLVFVGLMGAGKTTVARLVADQLGRPLRDCDEDVRNATGMSAAELAARHGIHALHEQETMALRAALREPDPVVVTAAASTIEDADCRAELHSVTVVWLRADPHTLAARAATSGHRPLHPDAEAQLRDQERRRHGLFESVADLVLDAGSRTAAELAAIVMSRI